MNSDTAWGQVHQSLNALCCACKHEGATGERERILSILESDDWRELNSGADIAGFDMTKSIANLKAAILDGIAPAD